MRNRLIAAVTFVLAASTLHAQTQTPASSGYLLPPKAIVDMLDAPPPPTAEVSPARDVIALLERASMPTIAELSQPFYRLAGVRINPRTNAPHRGQRYRNLTLKVIADGSERKVTLPPSPVITWIGFNADGKRFAFTQHARQRRRAVDWRYRDRPGQGDHSRAAQFGVWLAVLVHR